MHFPVSKFCITKLKPPCTNEIPYLNAEKYLNELSQFSKPPYPKSEKLFSPEKVVQTKQPKKSSHEKPLL